MATDPSDDPDFDPLDDPDDVEGILLKDELLCGARQDLAAASFLWVRRPRQARRLFDRAADVLGWLSVDDLAH